MGGEPSGFWTRDHSLPDAKLGHVSSGGLAGIHSSADRVLVLSKYEARWSGARRESSGGDEERVCDPIDGEDRVAAGNGVSGDSQRVVVPCVVSAGIKPSDHDQGGDSCQDTDTDPVREGSHAVEQNVVVVGRGCEVEKVACLVGRGVGLEEELERQVRVGE